MAATSHVEQVDVCYLLHHLQRRFNLTELRLLCTELGVDYENFPQAKGDFCMGLVGFCERRQDLARLAQAMYFKRRDAKLKDIIRRLPPSPPRLKAQVVIDTSLSLRKKDVHALLVNALRIAPDQICIIALSTGSIRALVDLPTPALPRLTSLVSQDLRDSSVPPSTATGDNLVHTLAENLSLVELKRVADIVLNVPLKLELPLAAARELVAKAKEMAAYDKLLNHLHLYYPDVFWPALSSSTSSSHFPPGLVVKSVTSFEALTPAEQNHWSSVVLGPRLFGKPITEYLYWFSVLILSLLILRALAEPSVHQALVDVVPDSVLSWLPFTLPCSLDEPPSLLAIPASDGRTVSLSWSAACSISWGVLVEHSIDSATKAALSGEYTVYPIPRNVRHGHFEDHPSCPTDTLFYYLAVRDSNGRIVTTQTAIPFVCDSAIPSPSSGPSTNPLPSIQFPPFPTATLKPP